MASMDEQLSSSHLIVLRDIRDHIDFLSEQQKKLEVQILSTIQPHSGNLGGLPPRWIAYNGMNHCRVSHLWSYRETAITSID